MPDDLHPSSGRRPAHHAALILLQAGALASVVAALPYQLFDLDRHSVPKELVLHLTAAAAAALCLRASRRLVPTIPDLCLAGFLLLSTLSALAASNWWLAFRALGLTLSSLLVFWSARAVTRAGFGRPLLRAFALAVVLGAVTGLLQAYGLWSALAAVNRAPGGTFGNRNFMAHYAALGLPLVVLAALEARSRAGYLLCVLGTTLSAAALFLTRSRAAWLALGASAAFLAIKGIWIGRLGADRVVRRRLTGLGIGALAGIVAAVVLPNTLDWRSNSPYLDTLRNVADYRSGSGYGRLVQFRNTLRLTARHPLLGVGPGNWPVQYPDVTTAADPSYDAAATMPTNPWPSSDWMALLSERGVAAFILLLLGGVTLVFPAWQRVRRGDRREALQSLALIAMCIVVAVVGSFDVALMLPAPALLFWGAAGALAPGGHALPRRAVGQAGIRRLATAVLAAGSLLAIRSGLQMAAMAVYTGQARVAVLERAARLDPGSYRIRMMLAGSWIARGRCDRGRVQAAAAARLFPRTAAPRVLIRSCARR